VLAVRVLTHTALQQYGWDSRYRNVMSTRKNLEGCHLEGDGSVICAYVQVAAKGRYDGWMDEGMDVMDWGMDKMTGRPLSP
jgi:hypothetical protein